MSSSHDQRYITRRDFLKKAGLAAGVLAGSALACGRGEKLTRLTTTPSGVAPTTGPETTPIPTAPSLPTATAVPSASTPLPPTPTSIPPELAANMVLVSGKVITVDPADTITQAVAVKDGLIQAIIDGIDALPSSRYL